MMNYTCELCGGCCKIFHLPVKNKSEIIVEFIKQFGFKLKSYDIKILIKGECEHLNKNNRCCIYEERSQRCKDFFCKRYTSCIPEGQLYRKRCRVCGNICTFQSLTLRDKQGVCGECWNW
jgi:hypothetical protein